MATFTREELETELLYWVKRHRDADTIADDFCPSDIFEINEPIGDYVYHRLTGSKDYKRKNQHEPAQFETLSILIPKLDGTPLANANLGGRFSQDLYDEFLSETELQNLKEVWQSLSENQKNLLRSRIQLPDGPNIASDPDFLDTARDPFWTLTVSTLRSTYNKVLTKTIKAQDGSRRPKYPEDVVFDFFDGIERFATADATNDGYSRWILGSITKTSPSKIENERLLTTEEVEAGGFDTFQTETSSTHSSGLINDEYSGVVGPALDALVEFLTVTETEKEEYKAKMRTAWGIAPQLVFILIRCILEEETSEFNLFTGKSHKNPSYKDINALKQDALNRLNKSLKEIENDDAQKLIYVDIYELLHRGTRTQRDEKEDRVKHAVETWLNRILNVIVDKILDILDTDTRALQELLSTEGQPRLIDKAEIRELLKKISMKKPMWKLIKDVWPARQRRLVRDTNLAAAICEELGLPANASVSLEVIQIQRLTTLSAQEQEISDLNGLEHATKLKRLKLANNSLSDISPLAGLTELTTLNLSENDITDITPLADLTKLTTLNLSGNDITDISPLAGLTKLTTLNLSGNDITDISPLAGLTKLTTLNLSGNDITDMTPLAGLTELTMLNLSGNDITDMTPLAGLTELTTLP